MIRSQPNKNQNYKYCSQKITWLHLDWRSPSKDSSWFGLIWHGKNHNLLPLLPPFLRVLSLGIGVTSSENNITRSIILCRGIQNQETSTVGKIKQENRGISIEKWQLGACSASTEPDNKDKSSIITNQSWRNSYRATDTRVFRREEKRRWRGWIRELE